ncbi:MAG TPA: polyprenyl synthetase family protein [Acidimicrobiia bacterium]|nr:polyprenyl synthetase family protein [Acidimicrobiia bacterium]
MEPAATRFVDEALAAHRRQVATALAGYLPSREPRRWLYDLVASYPARLGKGIRSSLCLAACRAFGGSTEEALPSAAAIELLHNAFMVHDDIEDGSLSRRGLPTLHQEHGLALAINAGDGLAVIGLSPLRDNLSLLGTEMAGRVADEFHHLLNRTIEGQAIELGWRAENVLDLTPGDYLHMVLLKTCSYSTIFPLRIGALIGSWGQADLDALTRFGFYLGAAFQIRDDLLNLEAASAEYGKESWGDLYEGKRTLMIIHLLNRVEGEEQAFLHRFLTSERPARLEADARKVVRLMEEHGSIDFAREFSEGIAEAAREAFLPAFAGLPPSDDLTFIKELVPYMLERRF